LKLKVKFEFLD